MNTELPRAEEALLLENQENKINRFEQLSHLWVTRYRIWDLEQALPPPDAPGSRPQPPSRGSDITTYSIQIAEYDKRLAEWEQTPEGVKFLEAERYYYHDILQRAGLEVDINSSKSFDEQLEERYGPDAEFLEKIFDDLIKGSWDDYEDPGPDSSNEKMGEAEVKFALGILRKRYSELAQEARDVAVLACNQNGIYQ